MSLAPAHAREKLECLIACATECLIARATECLIARATMCLIACATNVYVGQAGEQDADDLAAADDDVRILCLNPNPKP